MGEIAAVTYNDVVQAAQMISSTGRNASSVAVRERLGRGSFSTIKKHLDRWQSDRTSDARPSAPPVPPQLESLWHAARNEAEQMFMSERRELEVLSEQLDERWEAMETQAQEAQAQLAHALQRIADKDAELARQQAQSDDLRAQRTEAAEALKEARQELAEVRSAQAQRLDSLDHSIGELTRVFQTITEPLASFAPRVSAVGDLVEHEFGQLRKDLSAHENTVREEMRGLISPGQVLLASLKEQLAVNIEMQRHSARRFPSKRFEHRNLRRK